MKKIMMLFLMISGTALIISQYPNMPNIKPPIPADIDNALLTWAIINAATKEQKECNLYIDRYQISTTSMSTGGKDYIYETMIDTYKGEVVSRKRFLWSEYTRN